MVTYITIATNLIPITMVTYIPITTYFIPITMVTSYIAITLM